MNNIKAIRNFLGCKNFEESKLFYTKIGFNEIVLTHYMSLFTNNTVNFYLQDYYLEDWVNNTMVVMEVDQLVEFIKIYFTDELLEDFKTVRVSQIKEEYWAHICYVHDPAGNLLIISQFK